MDRQEVPMKGKSRRGRVKRVLRSRDGSLYDADEQRPITLEELADHMRAGGHFQARRRETGTDCTPQLMMEVYRANIADMILPGNPFGGMGGLGGLGGLVGLGRDASGASLAGSLLRFLDDGGRRDRDHWDDGQEERRRDDRWPEARGRKRREDVHREFPDRVDRGWDDQNRRSSADKGRQRSGGPRWEDRPDDPPDNRPHRRPGQWDDPEGDPDRY
jgi:hypothetical protein